MADEQDQARYFGFNRQAVAAALVGAASLGLQLAVPALWPEMDHRIGTALLLLSLLAFALAGLLSVRGRKAIVPERRWSVVGIGQGWVETRVRNNAGDQLMVTSNPGGNPEQIGITVTFSERKRPRRSDTTELMFDVDGRLFEWDIPDTGSAEFTVSGMGWRMIGGLKQMLGAMRTGKTVKVLIPSLALQARFTLVGAFDVLADAANLGDAVDSG